MKTKFNAAIYVIAAFFALSCSNDITGAEEEIIIYETKYMEFTEAIEHGFDEEDNFKNMTQTQYEYLAYIYREDGSLYYADTVGVGRVIPYPNSEETLTIYAVGLRTRSLVFNPDTKIAEFNETYAADIKVDKITTSRNHQSSIITPEFKINPGAIIGTAPVRLSEELYNRGFRVANSGEMTMFAFTGEQVELDLSNYPNVVETSRRKVLNSAWASSSFDNTLNYWLPIQPIEGIKMSFNIILTNINDVNDKNICYRIRMSKQFSSNDTKLENLAGYLLEAELDDFGTLSYDGSTERTDYYAAESTSATISLTRVR